MQVRTYPYDGNVFVCQYLMYEGLRIVVHTTPPASLTGHRSIGTGWMMPADFRIAIGGLIVSGFRTPVASLMTSSGPSELWSRLSERARVMRVSSIAEF